MCEVTGRCKTGRDRCRGEVTGRQGGEEGYGSGGGRVKGAMGLSGCSADRLAEVRVYN